MCMSFIHAILITLIIWFIIWFGLSGTYQTTGYVLTFVVVFGLYIYSSVSGCKDIAK